MTPLRRGTDTADLFPSTATVADAKLTGFLTFAEFASGDWPFKGRKTPKNPHAKDTAEHADWQQGYDGALTEWFA